MDQYRSVRRATSEVARGLTAEDQMVQSTPDASPLKWHQAHTTWFFETFLLREFAAGYREFHPDFHWLFNSYYVSLGEEIPEKKLRASFSRPTLESILEYRAHVDAAMETLLLGPLEDEVVRRVVMGLHHEQQHQELALTDVKHAFFTNPLHPVYRDGVASTPATEKPLRWSEFAGGLQEIGYALNATDAMDFCFDNETPRNKVYLEPFRLGDRLTTCREYLEFMADNGYGRAELWLSEGWASVEAEGWRAPLYWQRSAEDATGWKVFTMAGYRGLSEMVETPVCHVSFFEAEAFARWKGCRLPTEAEWEFAAVASGAEARSLQSGSAAQVATANLWESGVLHPLSARGDGLQQMMGDCWEWTASPYTGYPGYKPLPGALGEYNGKFMSSQMILRGGSCVTAASHIRPTYRNFFGPSTRWQFSGIRLAR